MPHTIPPSYVPPPPKKIPLHSSFAVYNGKKLALYIFMGLLRLITKIFQSRFFQKPHFSTTKGAFQNFCRSDTTFRLAGASPYLFGQFYMSTKPGSADHFVLLSLLSSTSLSSLKIDRQTKKMFVIIFTFQTPFSSIFKGYKKILCSALNAA